MQSHQLAIVLVAPDIPQNTGNIIRLCANTGCELHLVKPLGFPLDDRKLRRAGLDYHEYANIIVHDTWRKCREHFGSRRLIAIETSGSNYYHDIQYTNSDVLVFGSETRGLSVEILSDIPTVARIPMQKKQRSINLSNSVALVVFEAWRQLGFIGGL